jgi:hypothetical protein
MMIAGQIVIAHCKQGIINVSTNKGGNDTHNGNFFSKLSYNPQTYDTQKIVQESIIGSCLEAIAVAKI